MAECSNLSTDSTELGLLLLDAAYWNKLGQDLLEKELEKQRYNTRAKNVILFLGDGMSIPTITAARIYKGQKDGQSGEETELTFDKFPYVALSRVRSILSLIIIKLFINNVLTTMNAADVLRGCSSG